MGSIRYIGSKLRIVDQILRCIGQPKRGYWFFDVFSGTGNVSRIAACRGWNIKANDFLFSSTALTTAQIISEKNAQFKTIGGYKAALNLLNREKPIEGFIYREYTPSGQSSSGHKRLYFTCDNGRKIDSIRLKIEGWFQEKKIKQIEKTLLLADLIEAANEVANTAGTYGCFLNRFNSNAKNSINLVPRKLLNNAIKFKVMTEDVFDIEVGSNDIVYMDPPYTKRQYAAYYHILETIVAGDEPLVDGITGLRPWKKKSSVFCYKTKALKALLELVEKFESKKIFISYNSEGHINLKSLITGLEKFANVWVFKLGNIGRYTPNIQAVKNSTKVTEYLLEVCKT